MWRSNSGSDALADAAEADDDQAAGKGGVFLVGHGGVKPEQAAKR